MKKKLLEIGTYVLVVNADMIPSILNGKIARIVGYDYHSGVKTYTYKVRYVKQYFEEYTEGYDNEELRVISEGEALARLI